MLLPQQNGKYQRVNEHWNRIFSFRQIDIFFNININIELRNTHGVTTWKRQSQCSVLTSSANLKMRVTKYTNSQKYNLIIKAQDRKMLNSSSKCCVTERKRVLFCVYIYVCVVYIEWSKASWAVIIWDRFSSTVERFFVPQTVIRRRLARLQRVQTSQYNHNHQ